MGQFLQKQPFIFSYRCGIYAAGLVSDQFWTAQSQNEGSIIVWRREEIPSPSRQWNLWIPHPTVMRKLKCKVYWKNRYIFTYQGIWGQCRKVSLWRKICHNIAYWQSQSRRTYCMAYFFYFLCSYRRLMVGDSQMAMSWMPERDC